jgi:hypothetical protein
LNSPDDVDTDSLKNEYLKLKDENERLKKRIEELTKEVRENFINFSWSNRKTIR